MVDFKVPLHLKPLPVFSLAAPSLNNYQNPQFISSSYSIMAPATSLCTLPPEIQCAIFRLLDPVGLISASQTCLRFRKLISPSRAHFVERLLVLECQEKDGGPTPVFTAHNGYLDPDWNSAEWNAMRWACSGCLRLLPHTSFDNHSLLRLRYRKPIPGSPAADLYTSWEPTRKTLRKDRQKQQTLERRREEKRLRTKYGIAVSYSWNRPKHLDVPGNQLIDFQEYGMESFQKMTQAEYIGLNNDEWKRMMDQEARAVELEHCGSKRHLRRCIECRFQRGEFRSRTTVTGGTLKVPIVRSRKIRVGTVIDRYFPNISEILDSKRPTNNRPLFRVYRDDAHEELWTIYMIRCPGCARWKDNRAFRFGYNYPHDPPSVGGKTFYHGPKDRDWEEITTSVIDILRCNNCYVKEVGRETLGKELVRWVKMLVTEEKRTVEHRLGFGWRPILQRIMKCPAQWRCEAAQILTDPRDIAEEVRANYDDGLAEDDIALFHQRYTQWMELRGRMAEKGKTAWIGELNWVRIWTHEFTTLEAHWHWLKSIEDEVDGKVDALVDWALSSSQ